MKRSVYAVALAAAAILPAPALASPDQVVSIEAPVATWQGPAQLGGNVSFFSGGATPAACGTSPENYCDTTKVTVQGPYPEGVVNKALTFRLEGFETSDYDLRVSKATASGARGTNIAPTGDGRGLPINSVLPTGPGDWETTSASSVKAGNVFIVDVVYFATVPTERPTMKVTLK